MKNQTEGKERPLSLATSYRILRLGNLNESQEISGVAKWLATEWLFPGRQNAGKRRS